MRISFLNKPLPGAEFNSLSLFKYFLVGLFVAFFLLIFQPFEINEWQTTYKTLKIMGYGAVSFVVPAVYSFSLFLLIPDQIKEDKWTVGKEIVSVTCVIVFIAAGNMLYGQLIGIMHISFINFVNALVPVALLGIFPVSFLVLSRHNRLFKTNTEQANTVNQQLKHDHAGSALKPEETSPTVNGKLVLVSENGKDKIELHKEALYYIETADNYSNIVFIEEGKLKRLLLRSSLKRLEGQLSHPCILRCHRAYIVNLHHVVKVEGNAAGYKLSLAATAETIPVSRAFGPSVIEKLKSLG